MAEVEYRLVATRNGLPPIKKIVSQKLVNSLKSYLIELPNYTCVVAAPNPAQIGCSEELLLPTSSYQKVMSRIQEFLRDDSLAADIVTLVEAMESEHVSIIFEPKLVTKGNENV